MSKFQIIVLSIFILCIVGGIALFATYKNKDASTALPTVTIWGTFPSSLLNQLVTQLNITRATPLSVNYIQKSPTDFNKDFVEALATGQGPDAVLLPQDMFLQNENKFIPIPTTVLTERDYKNTYISEADLYYSPSGTIAIPFVVDPLVMYWNRDLFTNAGIATYPKYWDEFIGLTTKIDQKDVNSNIRRSAIAMGEFSNINNAREILGTLLIQAGNPVTVRGDATSGGGFVSTLGDGQFSGAKISEPAVTFFTQFANPRDPLYSWNRGLPMSKSWFLSGSLATYFGFASELFDLRGKNPNMDFDVAPLPQARNGANRATYGKMYGFSVVRASRNPGAAYNVFQILTAPDALTVLGKLSSLPPVRRDMIASGSTDPYQAIFYDAALISKGWLDMDPTKTSKIFQTMVESITSGRAQIHEAIETAHDSLDLSLQNR